MQEYRQITFAPQDVIKALDYFRRRNRIPEIGTRLKRIGFDDRDGPVTTTVQLSDDGAAPRCLIIDATELLAALVSYCLYTRVPLPKSGERRISLIDGNPTLTMTGIRPRSAVEP